MSSKKTSGKQLRQSIAQTLRSTFTELSNAKESKKIERSIRKASKALATGLKAAHKNGAPTKKAESVAATVQETVA